MNKFRRLGLPRSMRFLLVSTAVGSAVLAGAAVVAIAAYPSDSVTVMTGCLTASGVSAGNLGSIAVGGNPAKPCSPNQKLVHLSGGTITQVTAGTGLTTSGSGGTDTGGSPNSINNGFATLGLQSGYQLPQSNCSSGQVVASDGSGGWTCQTETFAQANQTCDSGQFLTGFDSTGLKQCGTDQTYTNGTGLDLSGNTFSVKPAYQLPQSCNSGDVAQSNGSNGWSCGSAGGLGPKAYYDNDLNDIEGSGYRNVVGFNESLPPATYFISATIRSTYASGQSDGGDVFCALLKNGTVDPASGGTPVSDATGNKADSMKLPFYTSATMSAVATVGATDTLYVWCTNLGGTPTEVVGTMSAIPLSSATSVGG